MKTKTSLSYLFTIMTTVIKFLQHLLAKRRVLVVLATSFILIFLILHSFIRTDVSNRVKSQTTQYPILPQNKQQKSSSTQNVLLSSNDVDWRRFAYVQYVTNALYLCNSVMIFEQLHRLGAKPDLLLLYPSIWDTQDFKTSNVLDNEKSLSSSENKKEDDENKKDKRYFFDTVFDDKTAAGDIQRLLQKAKNEYGAVLKPIEIVQLESSDTTWAESFTKLLIFNQTQYDRVLFMDSDGSVNGLLDHLFLLPSAPVAATRSYWFSKEELQNSPCGLNAQLELVEPSTQIFNDIMDTLKTGRQENEYDMEIFNKLFGDSALIIPHRRTMILSGEFRNKPQEDGKEHQRYMGKYEPWDAQKVFSETPYIHFSDWPHPKV